MNTMNAWLISGNYAGRRQQKRKG